MFTIKIKFDTINIYIKDILYVKIRRSEYIGLQSWENENIYYIEIYTRTNSILLELGTKEKWIELLNLIDKNL